jgi:hypothetical protein
MKKEQPKQKPELDKIVIIDDASDWERMKKIEEVRKRERGGVKPKYGTPPKKK